MPADKFRITRRTVTFDEVATYFASLGLPRPSHDVGSGNVTYAALVRCRVVAGALRPITVGQMGADAGELVCPGIRASAEGLAR
jgi:hypothetical protein